HSRPTRRSSDLTAVLSNQKANQLSKGCYLTKYLSNSVIVFTTNLFILSNMMKCGPRRTKVNYCDISNIQLRTKRTQSVVAQSIKELPNLLTRSWIGGLRQGL